MIWGNAGWTASNHSHQREYLKGFKALQEGDYARALDIYTPLAKSGHGPSNMDIGVMYLEGWGTEANPQKALEFFRKAGASGSLRAQALLGMLLLDGKYSIGRDPAEASKWIEDAANQGHVESVLKLARMHERGMGIPEDLMKAAVWYGRAGKLNHPKGKEKLVKLKKSFTSDQISTIEIQIQNWTPKPTSDLNWPTSRH